MFVAVLCPVRSAAFPQKAPFERQVNNLDFGRLTAQRSTSYLHLQSMLLKCLENVDFFESNYLYCTSVPYSGVAYSIQV
jgi:hypothetical protein